MYTGIFVSSGTSNATLVPACAVAGTVREAVLCVTDPPQAQRQAKMAGIKITFFIPLIFLIVIIWNLLQLHL